MPRKRYSTEQIVNGNFLQQHARRSNPKRLAEGVEFVSGGVVPACLNEADDRLWKLGEIGERGLRPTALDTFELQPGHGNLQ